MADLINGLVINLPKFRLVDVFWVGWGGEVMFSWANFAAFSPNDVVGFHLPVFLNQLRLSILSIPEFTLRSFCVSFGMLSKE